MLKSKPMLPVQRQLTYIGQKYNAHKFLSFIVTDNAGITQADIPYLSQHLDQFPNVANHPVNHPLVMHKSFGYINVADFHNKSGHSGLALEKFCVTQCDLLWLCITVALVIPFNNYWKLFCHGVKRYHYEKFIDIREFL